MANVILGIAAALLGSAAALLAGVLLATTRTLVSRRRRRFAAYLLHRRIGIIATIRTLLTVPSHELDGQLPLGDWR